MEFTDKMRLIFTKLDTTIALEDDDQKKEVLRRISEELQEEIRQAEYIVQVGVGTNKQEIQNTLERISEETNQKELTIKITSNQQLDEEARKEFLRHSWRE